MKRLILLFVCSALLLTACQPINADEPVLVFATGVDPESWATIPPGEFLFGQFEEEQVIEYAFQVMTTDVTNAQYTAFLNAALADGSAKVQGSQIVGYYPGDVFNGGRHEEQVNAGDYLYLPLDDPALRLVFSDGKFAVKPGWQDHPMTMVSWFGAKAYCEYYGSRLPTEKEWEKAARGGDGRPFPWGDEISRNIANYISSRDPFENMRSYGSRTSPVGFYNGRSYDGYQTIDSANPYGLYDMAGNVWQWTGDVYPYQHYRYMRGGSMNQYPNRLRIWSRNSASPDFVSPAVGFRCARDVE